MKKISILIMMFVLSIITLFSVSSYAIETLRTYYEIDFNENTMAVLDTGEVITNNGYYTSDFINILNNEVYMTTPSWQFILWYDSSNVYKGFTVNNRAVIMEELITITDVAFYLYPPTDYDPFSPNILTTNIYDNVDPTHNVVKFKVALSGDNLYWTDEFAVPIFSLYYNIPLNSIIDVNTIFFAKFYRNDYNVLFPNDTNNNNLYLKRRYELSPGRVVNNTPIVFDYGWVLSEELEIKFNNVRRTHEPAIFRWNLAPEFWLTTYNDYHILIWFDSNHNYLGFSTSYLVDGISTELLPYYLGSYDMETSPNINLIPSAIFNSAKYFRIMNNVYLPNANEGGTTLDLRFENNNLFLNYRVGLRFRSITDGLNIHSTIPAFIPRSTRSHLGNYNFYYTSDLAIPDKTIEYNIYNILNIYNINNSDGKFIIALSVTLILSIVVLFYGGNFGVFLFVGVFSSLVFVMIGWMPSWIGLTLILIAAILLIFKVTLLRGAYEE